MNKDIVKAKFIFRCDGGYIPEIGTGHVSRCLVIAKSLVKETICKAEDILFAIRKDLQFSNGYQTICKSEFKVIITLDKNLVPNTRMEADMLSKFCNGVIIVDRFETEEKFIKQLKHNGNKVVTLDDQGKGALFADAVINAILPTKLSGPNVYRGYEYLVTNNLNLKTLEYSNNIENNIHLKESKYDFNIFASFGGYDHRKYLYRFLKIIEKHISNGAKGFTYNLIGGDEFINDQQNKILINKINSFKSNVINTFSNPTNFYNLMNDADLAIVNGGLTLFDAVAYCIPSIGVAQYKHQLETLITAEKEGIVEMVSKKINFSDEHFYETFIKLINNKELRYRISLNCKGKIDGRGAQKISILLKRILNQ